MVYSIASSLSDAMTFLFIPVAFDVRVVSFLDIGKNEYMERRCKNKWSLGMRYGGDSSVCKYDTIEIIRTLLGKKIGFKR